MVNTRSENKLIEQIEQIKQIKLNLKEIFKDESREIIEEEFSDLEKVSSTVNLLQKHVSSLKESKIAL